MIAKVLRVLGIGVPKFIYRSNYSTDRKSSDGFLITSSTLSKSDLVQLIDFWKLKPADMDLAFLESRTFTIDELPTLFSAAHRSAG